MISTTDTPAAPADESSTRRPRLVTTVSHSTLSGLDTLEQAWELPAGRVIDRLVRAEIERRKIEPLSGTL